MSSRSSVAKGLGALALALLLLLPRPVLAQDRSPTARQSLVELAYVLGEVHAMRQRCRGRTDYYWYTRMKQLLDVEASDQALAARLANTFNTGYAAAQARFPSCDKALKSEMAQLSQQGQTLSDQLAKP
jgi:uncharacterized protein (TIGR02301 family)